MENSITYSEPISYYGNITQLGADIIKEVGIKDLSISYTLLFSVLINQGYFSNNFKLIKTTDVSKTRDIKGYFGMDIVIGYGCCRHFSSIHEDIFKHLKLNGEKIPCYTHSLARRYREEFSFDENTVINIPEDYMTKEDLLYMNKGDHDINIIEHKGITYGHDSANKYFLKFQDGLNLISYGLLSPEEVQFSYKPQSHAVDNINAKDFARVFDFEEIALLPEISYKELREIYMETLNRIDKNQAALEDYKSQVKPYTKKMADSINKIKAINI